MVFRSRTLRRGQPIFGAPCWLIACLVLLLAALGQAALRVRPCRVLVLADARVRDGRVLRDAGELGDVVALLSLWGIPHDVLRLDTQVLREQSLLGAEGQPAYGAIVWAIRSDLLPRRFSEGEVLREACLKHHISLIALGGRIDVAAVQEILGVRVLSWRDCVPPLTAAEPTHFITRAESPLPRLADEPWCATGPLIEPSGAEVRVLLSAGEQPLLTARTLDAGSGVRAVWLGGDANRLLRSGGAGLGIRLFQRALAWSLGAVVVHNYDNTMLLRMDDPGAAQASYLHGWDYPSLSEALLRQKVLAPLREHHGRLSVFCCPGYVDARTGSILHAEQVDLVDVFGNRQNIRSMFTTLLEGQRQGLIDIASHGWTHMAPDLEAPACGGDNWWAGNMSTEWADWRWYREFYDLRRDREVPAEAQLQHLRTSCDWLEGYFGRRPLAFCPPGHAVSGDSWVYPKEMAGTLEVRLEGVEPKASYRLFVGDDEEWASLGELHADAAGSISAALPVPAHVWLDARGYFTINPVAGHTQFIAGPIREALGFDFSLALRDKARMSPSEREEFAASGQCLRQGRISAHLHRETYRPPVRSAACTYQAAGRAGLGLMIDTACHALQGEQVTTLRMVPVVGCPEDVAAAASSRAGMPAVFRFHDFDLIEEPDFLIKAFKVMSKGGRLPACLSADELAGYLHARWTVRRGPDNSLVATGDFSAVRCRYLRDHDSSWTLLASDEVLSALRGPAGRLVVGEDGAAGSTPIGGPGQTGPIPVRVAAGRAMHTVVVHAETP